MKQKSLLDLKTLRDKLEKNRDKFADLATKSDRRVKIDRYVNMYAETIVELEDVEKKIEALERKHLSNVYCGSKKPKKGKRLGTQKQCKEKGQHRLYGKKIISDKSGGSSELVRSRSLSNLITKKDINKLVADSLKPKKGGALPALLIKKFLKASHEPFSDVDNYKIDRGLSHEWVRVYYNSAKNHAVIVHRGSAGLDDAWTDVKLAFEQKNNKRFKTSEKIQKQAEKKYGAQNVTTLGHSLGGYISEQVGQNSKEVITISKPTTFKDVLTGKEKGEKQTDIRTTADLIALLQNFQKGKNDIVLPSENFDPVQQHKGQNVMDKLPDDKMIGEGRMRKMTVKELKAIIKKLRKGKANQYPINGKRKQELIVMLKQLQS